MNIKRVKKCIKRVLCINMRIFWNKKEFAPNYYMAVLPKNPKYFVNIVENTLKYLKRLYKYKYLSYNMAYSLALTDIGIIFTYLFSAKL